jgi:hypothetical protein
MFIPGCEPTGHIDFVLKARGGEVEMVGNELTPVAIHMRKCGLRRNRI